MYLYLPGHSFFHQLHPVTKLVLLALMIVAAFFARTVPAIVAVFFAHVAVLLAAGGRPNLGKFWKLLAIFWAFTFGIWIIIPGLRNAPWSYSNSALLATRVDTFVVAGLIFVTITRIEEFTLGLTGIGVPYKAAFVLSLGFRLVPLFYQNLRTIVAAQRSRGVDLDSGNLFQRFGKYIPIMGVLISYSIRNADLMAMSLEAKGFGYSPRRTSFLRPGFSWRDALAIGLLILIIAGLHFWTLS